MAGSAAGIGLALCPVEIHVAINSWIVKCVSGKSPRFRLIGAYLYRTRLNIEIVHEILRQSFLIPNCPLPTLQATVAVYQNWLSQTPKPSFMDEPGVGESSNSPTAIRFGIQQSICRMMRNAALRFHAAVPAELAETQFQMCVETLSLFHQVAIESSLHLTSATW